MLLLLDSELLIQLLLVVAKKQNEDEKFSSRISSKEVSKDDRKLTVIVGLAAPKSTVFVACSAFLAASA